MAAGESPLGGRSSCRTCKTKLGVTDLIPVVSWLFLRGRCRHCGGQVGWTYPVVEVMALGVAAWSALVLDGWLVWVSCGLGWTLLVLAAIDARTYRLPDVLTLPLVLGGLAVAAGLGWQALLDHSIGVLIGWGGFVLVAVGYRAVRNREGLGLGDAKLLAAGGAWTSWTGLPGIVLIACASAFAVLLVRVIRGEQLSQQTKLAFGPPLCVGIWIVWLYGPVEFGAF